MLHLFFGTALAAPVQITSVSTSSDFSDDGTSYAAKHLSDGKSTTAWVENDKGSGVGSWIKVALEKEASISEIALWNGNWYSFNEWDFYNRASKVELTFSNGSKQTVSFNNSESPKVERITLDKPVSTDSIRMVFKGVHSGSAYAERLALSEVQVFDKSPLDFNKAAITSTSTLPQDNDGSYGVENLQDGLTDTLWCEGEEEGDGTGQSLTYKFNKTVTLNELELTNGNGTDIKMFMGYGKVKTIQLEFANGSTKELAVKASPRKQTHDLGGVKTSSVKITLAKVAKGSKVNDTCLSELIFR